MAHFAPIIAPAAEWILFFSVLMHSYGYQEQFAEKDEETGHNSFELRLYDARIGRLLSTDPAGQYWSP